MVRENGRGVRSLFEPRSIALIGASGDPGKIGHAVLKNVITGGYAGKIYPVNGRGGEVVGLHAFRSILDIGEPIDLACITIPAKGVYDAIVQCAEKGVRNAVVITSGFSEIGNF